jgi:hypothetical protein
LETNAPITWWTNPIYVNYPIVIDHMPWYRPSETICDISQPAFGGDQNSYISTNIGDSNGANSLSFNNVGNTSLNGTLENPKYTTLTSNNSDAVDVLEKKEHVYCVEI